MSTKFSIVLLVPIIALLITACQPVNMENSEPAASSATAVVIPVTGQNSAMVQERDALETRQWSGEIFFSESDAPDGRMSERTLNTPTHKCLSEEDQPRHIGGCVE